MPNLIGGIVLEYILQLIINAVLLYFNVDITFSAKYGFWGLIVLMNWQMAGYMMIIYIAGIQSISQEVIEAAKIDGASTWQIIRSITIPLADAGSDHLHFFDGQLQRYFKLFDQNFALTYGAPARQSSMLALDIYFTFYGSTGYEGFVGQAKAVMFFILVAIIVLLQLRFSRSREVEI